MDEQKNNTNNTIAFNPVKEDKDGIIAKRMIWSTKAIDAAYEGLKQGRKLVANPFYENNTKLLKGDLNFERTNDEIAEWLKCRNNIVYFADTYCKLLTPEGIQHVTLRDYQRDYLKHLEKNRLSIFLSCRQSGKTTTSALFMLHYILFNFDKNALVLGNKRKTATEILDKAKKIFIELPFFLRPGIYKWNEGEIVLDNGCRLMAEATTINSGISYTFHCVLADEFAHIQPNIMEKFYNNLFPTITAGKARFMITSTQNGYNLFYRLYSAAVAGENEYAPFKVDWWQVPEWNPDKRCWEKRTEEWHQLQVANYGGEDAFNRQFGTNFSTNNDTLISSKKLRAMQPNAKEYVVKDLNGVRNADSFFWNPEYEPMVQLQNDYIVITIDIAEGIGGDSTVMQFNKMVHCGDDVWYENVGFFRNNYLEVKDCVNSMYDIALNYMDMYKFLVSLEYNIFGELFVRCFYDVIEKNPDNMGKLNEDVIIKYDIEGCSKTLLGIKMTTKSKLQGCMQFKQDLEKGLIRNDSTLFLNELNNFADNKGNNTYQASFGHDDMVMSQMQLSLARSQQQVKELEETFKFGNQTNIDIYNPYEFVSPEMDISYNNIYGYEFDTINSRKRFENFE